MVRVPWGEELAGRRLLVSGFGRWGGGVYDLTSGRPRAYDDLPTSGLSVGAGRVWRVLRSPGEQTGACELLSYDGRGVSTYQRLDEVRDPHDVRWHTGALHIASSWDDMVWRLSGGAPEPLWRASAHGGPAVPDAWHLNSLTVAGGTLLACAFGRFDRHRAWKAGEKKGTGFVVDLATGRDVLTHLTQPHAPRLVGDRWYVCESSLGYLTELDTGGTVLRRAAVERFTRGLTVLGRWALVGGNAHRDHDDDRAEVAVVDLANMAVVERIPMPCLEVYDIVPVPGALARGVATGFGGNASRAVEQHRGVGRPTTLRPTPDRAAVRLTTPVVAERLAAMGTVREGDEETLGRCAVRGTLGHRAVAGTTGVIQVEVVNGSRRLLGTVPPRPVRVGSRWFPVDADGAALGDPTLAGPLVPLPRVLHPGQAATVEVPLEVPEEPGVYELRVALRQQGVGWFGVRAESRVEVLDPLTHGDRPADGRAGVPGGGEVAAGEAAAVPATPARGAAWGTR